LDVRRGKIHGLCEISTGVSRFERLLEQVLSQELGQVFEVGAEERKLVIRAV
jgi:hypothetical protein